MESARTLRRIVGIINFMTCCAEFLHHLCVILVSPTACYEIFAICGNACESKDSEIRLIGQREQITSCQALLPPAKAASERLGSARQTFPSDFPPAVKDCFGLHSHYAFGSVAKEKSGVGRKSATSVGLTTDLVH